MLPDDLSVQTLTDSVRALQEDGRLDEAETLLRNAMGSSEVGLVAVAAAAFGELALRNFPTSRGDEAWAALRWAFNSPSQQAAARAAAIIASESAPPPWAKAIPATPMRDSTVAGWAAIDLGRFAEYRQESELAEAWFTRAIRLSAPGPSMRAAHLLASLLEATERPKQAIPLWRHAVADPDPLYGPVAKHSLAQLLEKTLGDGDPLEEIESLYREAFDEGSINCKTNASASLALLLARTGRKEEAEKFARFVAERRLGGALSRSRREQIARLLDEAGAAEQADNLRAQTALEDEIAEILRKRPQPGEGAGPTADMPRPTYPEVQDETTTTPAPVSDSIPWNTNLVENAQLFVGTRALDAFDGLLPASHLSLVLRLDGGELVEYEGRPERQIPFMYGRIIVTKRPYRPRPDRRGLAVPIYVTEVLNAETLLDDLTERLNGAAIGYQALFGPNSNTVVRTFLLRLGFQPLQPAAVAPGFEHDAL